MSLLDEDVETPTVDDAADADDTPARPRDYTHLKEQVKTGTWLITIATFVVVFAAGVIGNWQRSQNVDPEYTYDIVLRTIHFGGTYYENAIHNKGPLEPFVYQVSSWITSRDGFWYGISFFIALAALIIGVAAARTVMSMGGNKELAIAAAAVVFVHLVFGKSDYAGVLYARNMTTPLLCATWIIALSERCWSDRRRAMAFAIVSGALLGLAVQTHTTTAFAAVAVSLTALALVRLRRPKEEHGRIDIAFVVAGAVAFLSAPVWYLARGKFTEFFSGWWTYARFMSIGTGRSLGSQFALGWHTIYLYYQQRPLTAVANLAFIAMVVLDWERANRRQRIIYAGLLGWFAGAWIELILSQRYSSHYFIVSTVPTALMIAALAGRVYRAVVEQRGAIRFTFAWPIVAFFLAIWLSGSQLFVQSMQDLSKFTSVHDHAVQVDKAQGGDIRQARAVLDLVSKNWDPLLVWTNDPWPYLDYHRVSATRFIWESFMQGQIYLGRTSNAYVLPDTWKWFREDLDKSKPVAYLKSNGGPIPPGIPFASVVDTQFTTVYPDSPIPIEFRRDVANEILDPSAPDPWTRPTTPGSPTGWTTSAGSAQYREAGNRDQEQNWMPIANDSCFVLNGRVASDGPAGGIVFHFTDNAGKAESVNMDFDGDHVSSGSSAVEYRRIPSQVTTGGRTPAPFTLIVGRRAAGLIVNGQIRAAVRLPKSVHVAMESQRGILDVTDMRTGAAPAITGC